MHLKFGFPSVLAIVGLLFSPSGRASSDGGTVAFSSPTYTTTIGSGEITLSVNRTGGSDNAVSVRCATHYASAINSTNYTGVVRILKWDSGDSSPKSFPVTILDQAFTGTKSFTVSLSDVSGANLGTVAAATVTISGSGSDNGTLGFSSSTYSTKTTEKAVTITVNRSGEAAAASVKYSTKYGSAINGVNYTGKSDWIKWEAGDTAPKTFTVDILDQAVEGTKNFTVALSDVSGASLASPAAATVNLSTPSTTTAPPVKTTCAETSASWKNSSQGSHIYDYVQYGKYIVYVDNWGNLPGQATWANSAGCWGVTASASNTDIGYPRAYPHVTRGWAEDGSVLSLSTPGTYDWTTKAGLGIAVPALTKAKMHWAFTAPVSSACSKYCRWDALADVYFHKSATPAPTEWPPAIDLQIIQSLADQPVGNSTFYALVAANDHASTVTIGGSRYVIFVDDPGAASFHQSGGHTIAMFTTPTSFSSNNGNANWGVGNGVTDIADIIHYLNQSNPLDDAGKPLLNAVGAKITSPLIPSNLYLTAINAGWEIDVGAKFENQVLCVAMQSEPDCS